MTGNSKENAATLRRVEHYVEKVKQLEQENRQLREQVDGRPNVRADGGAAAKSHFSVGSSSAKEKELQEENNILKEILEQRKDELKRVKEDCNRKLEAVRTSARNQKQDYAKLKIEEGEKKAAQEIAYLKDKARSLEEQLKAAKEKAKKAEAEKERTVKDFDSKKHGDEGELLQLREDVLVQKQELDRLEDERAKRERDMEQIIDERDTLRREIAHAADGSRRRSSDSTRSMRAGDSGVNDGEEGGAAALAVATLAFEKEAKDLKATIKRLEREVKVKERLEERNQELEDELTRVNVELLGAAREQKHGKASETKAMHALRRENAELKTQVEEMEATKGELEAQLESESAANQQLREELEEVNGSVGRVDKLSTENRKLEKRVRDLEEEREGHIKKIEVLNKNKGVLEEKNRRLEHKKPEPSTRDAQEIRTLKATKTKLEGEIKTLRQQQEREKEENKRLQERINELEEGVSKKGEGDGHDEEAEKLQQERENLKEERVKLEEEKKVLEATRAEHEKRMAEMILSPSRRTSVGSSGNDKGQEKVSQVYIKEVNTLHNYLTIENSSNYDVSMAGAFLRAAGTDAEFELPDNLVISIGCCATIYWGEEHKAEILEDEESVKRMKCWWPGSDQYDIFKSPEDEVILDDPVVERASYMKVYANMRRGRPGASDVCGSPTPEKRARHV